MGAGWARLCMFDVFREARGLVRPLVDCDGVLGFAAVSGWGWLWIWHADGAVWLIRSCSGGRLRDRRAAEARPVAS